MDNLLKEHKQINKIDKQLLKLIKQRIDVVEQIGSIKKLQGLSIKDPKREKLIIAKLSEQGDEIGLAPEIIKKIWKTFFRISYKIEER